MTARITTTAHDNDTMGGGWRGSWVELKVQARSPQASTSAGKEELARISPDLWKSLTDDGATRRQGTREQGREIGSVIEGDVIGLILVLDHDRRLADERRDSGLVVWATRDEAVGCFLVLCPFASQMTRSRHSIKTSARSHCFQISCHHSAHLLCSVG